ncbi:MAG TPA: DUF2085 domain-containing protein [Desulfuromonadaceae bacterium]|jgi:uncharacterized membrane protein
MIDLTDNLTRLFSHVCHQLPERSFLIFKGKNILCARCTGMYSGLILGLILVIAYSKITNTDIFKLLCFAVILLIMEMLGEKVTDLHLGNVDRFMTGIIFGISVGIGLVLPIKQLLGGRK